MLVDLSHVSVDVMRHALRVTAAPGDLQPFLCPCGLRPPAQRARRCVGGIGGERRGVHGDIPARVRLTFGGPRWHAEARAEARRRGIQKGDLAYDELWRGSSSKSPPPVATLAQVVTHIEHVREVAGIDHVGIGGDYMGGEAMPEGLEDVSGYPRLFAALAERGWSRCRPGQARRREHTARAQSSGGCRRRRLADVADGKFGNPWALSRQVGIVVARLAEKTHGRVEV